MRGDKKSAEDLRRAVRGLDRRGYPALKSLGGCYAFDAFDLFIDHVQGDPFASPSSVRVVVPHKVAGFPQRFILEPCARVALADFLTRRFSAELARLSMRVGGSGKSGLLATSRCGQEVLERSACEVTDAGIVVRFHAGFPAFGRTVNGEGLEQMLLDFVPRCVKRALLFASLDAPQVEAAVNLAQDQQALRAAVREAGLVAFVANGSVLPRESGVSERPLKGGVPFVSPASLERAFVLPHAGEVRGMGVRRGVTLVVGGGYHGKSTLLAALQSGVYNHIAGDGREFVVTDGTALKLRAEDGRSVRDVDISAFIGELPNGKDTRAFSTPCASGSTSQAANVVEGIEAGARVMLVDEDTSATNFMVRDELMSWVITPDREPITPFLDRVRALYDERGVSTVMVAGSSGAFFRVADTVVQMDRYEPADVTQRAKEACVRWDALQAAGAGVGADAEAGAEAGERAGAGADGCAEANVDASAEAEAKAASGAEAGSAVTLIASAEAGAGVEPGWENACAQDGVTRSRSSRVFPEGADRVVPLLNAEQPRGRGRKERGGRSGGSGRGARSEDRGRHGGHDERGGERDGREGRGERDEREGRKDRGAAQGARIRVRALKCDTVSLDKVDVDVRYVEQIADAEQTLALGYLARFAIEQAQRCVARGEEPPSLQRAVHEAFAVLDEKGWEALCGSHVPCGLARPREQELYACLNRLRA